jgi:hypothetical protein
MTIEQQTMCCKIISKNSPTDRNNPTDNNFLSVGLFLSVGNAVFAFFILCFEKTLEGA